MDKAAQILPTSLTTTLSRRRGPPEPPPVLVAIRLQRGEDIYLPLPLNLTLHELLQRCAEESDVPVSTLYIAIEEDRPADPQGLLSAIRYTARSISSRELLREGFVDWVNFLFVPEAINREVRGRGVVSWFRLAILPHLQPPPPPHIAHVAVFLQQGRRDMIELSATATLSRLQDAVESQTGLLAERQRIIVAEEARQGPMERALWVVARGMYIMWCAIIGVVLSWAKWVALGPDKDQKVTLKLQCEGGEGALGSIGSGPLPGSKATDSLEVRADMTLAQLQHLVQLQRGDNVGLQGLLLTSGSGGGTVGTLTGGGGSIASGGGGGSRHYGGCLHVYASGDGNQSPRGGNKIKEEGVGDVGHGGGGGRPL